MNAREASNNLDGVGDLTVSGVRLSNRTYNSLKKDIRKKQEKGMVAGGRVEVATRSTQEGVMDEHTRLLILKMVNADVLSEVRVIMAIPSHTHELTHSCQGILEMSVLLGWSSTVSSLENRGTVRTFTRAVRAEYFRKSGLGILLRDRGCPEIPPS